MATRGTRKKTAEKPHYHHGDLRRALLDASLALISEEGFGALSLREVARRAGVTHAAPYRHFEHKEALLVAVAEEGFRVMKARMQERMARETSPEGRLVECGVAYVLFAMEHPAHFRVMFGPHFTQPPKLGPPGGDLDSFGLLVDSITQGQRAGVFHEGEPLSLALTCWSLVHGLSSLLVDRKLEMAGVITVAQAEKLALEQTRLLLRGLTRATSN
ncbi:TetR family transcriptional regulator [Archangium gephyra]|uniref:TetR family transcriptional regulator n=1 Tax=Archangium gephyra TaxID=48 RepID=A0AAC8QBH4_9BACT|nr:TetR/AcrR family transcriptional regulator [Archangium gephyra]AKJ04384.1 Transcriptional regulator, TetR family [Archangium gephyra]REG37539.1 TetR family transcriptional regulator [Archangium gephyra]